MRTFRYGGMMNDYEGFRGVGVVYGAACYLSHPRDVVKRGYLSSQDEEVYANRLALEANLPTSTCAERSSCNGIFPSSPDTPPGLPRLMASPVKYERGMMHTPEFCRQSSGWAHAAGSRHVVSAARCSCGQLVLPQASSISQMRWTRRHAGTKHVVTAIAKLLPRHQWQLKRAPTRTSSVSQ
jgi:hypothetical protein